MVKKLFLLGRPGSGKTTAFQLIQMLARDERWKTSHFTHFREYTTLQEIMASDNKSRFKTTEYDGFEIRDFSVLKESSKLLEENLTGYLSTTARSDELIFVELARDEYKESMKCFNPSFLENSYFLFVESDVETCIKRIHRRVAHPTSTGSHFVPDHVLRSYYSKDNLEYMASAFKADFDVRKEIGVINNRTTIPNYVEKVNDFAHTVLAPDLKFENIVNAAMAIL